MNNIDISKYVSYFHDGSIIDIQQTGNKVLISMESAEVSEEDINDEFELSEQKTIKGILHLADIIDIRVQKELFHEKLKMLADIGDILEFKLNAKIAKLFVKWTNYPPKKDMEEYSEIEITAETIFWDNIPDLPDPFGEKE